MTRPARSTESDNPLLEREHPIPFHRIRAEHVEPAIAVLLEDAQVRRRAVAELDGARTFQNTLLGLEAITERIEYAMAVVSHLEGVATDAELRAAYNIVQPKVSAFVSNIPLDPNLWTALKDYASGQEAHGLAGRRERFLKKTVDGFRRFGAQLDDPRKRRLEAIDIALATATTRYGQNALDSLNAFELLIDDERALAGLPDSAIEAARASAAEKHQTGWRFTLQAPSLIPLLTFLDDRSIRERIYRASNARATEGALDNRSLVLEILALRREKAQLLGYDNFAELVLEDRMAHDSAKARAFVDDLRLRTEPFFRREQDELARFVQELEGTNAPSLQPWDLAYYAEKLRRTKYDFDEEALRPYFPLASVVAGVFETVKRLYGVTVLARDDIPTWHPTVRAYDLAEGGHPIGTFYLDPFPRENKRDGAWMDGLTTAMQRGATRLPHVGIVCANVTPPTSERPALLTHREVETLFHEFGHLMHHLLTEVEIRSLAGTNVAWDFVELPSQIMENWCWERESLDLFARHYRTGATLPGPLLDKMRAARSFRAATAMMRQLGLASVDLALHVDYDVVRDGDVISYARNVMQAFAPVTLPDDYAMITSFGHLFAHSVGYSAAYYSYKWAEVLDADAFSRFRQGGLFSRSVGSEFRHKILAQGDGRDPIELYREFMGRDPALQPLLERSGLIS